MVSVYNPGSTKPSVGSGSNAITTNLGTFTGAICNKHLFGVATQGFPNYNPGNNFDQQLDAGDSTVLRNAYAQLGLRFVRMNGLGLIQDTYGSNVSNAPNFARVDKLISGFQPTFPLADLMVCWGNQTLHGAYADASLRQRFANGIRDIISRMEANGLHIKYCQTVNEPNQSGGPSDVNLADVENKTRIAVHALFPNILMVGPTTSYAQKNYIDKSVLDGNVEAIAYHRYERDPGNNNGPALTDVQLYSNAINQGNDVVTVQGWARAQRPGNYQIFKTEYFMDWYPLSGNPQYNPSTGVGNDSRQQNYKGAVFGALVAISHAYSGMVGAQLWRLEYFDGSYGPFSKTAFPALNPIGSFIKAANQYLGGSVTSITITSTGTNKILAMGTVDTATATFGLIVVNYDASNTWNGGTTNVSWTGSITINGIHPTANVTKWTLSSSSPTSTTTTIAPNTLGSVTIPSESILIFAGQTNGSTDPGDPPTNPTGFTVNWQNVAGGTPPIDNNTQHRETGQSTWIDNPLGTTTGNTQAITSLTPETGYDIRVKAENDYGTAFSDLIQATTGVGVAATIVIDNTQTPPSTMTDASGVVWNISTGGQCVYNGISDATTGSVVQMVLLPAKDVVWQKNSSQNWYFKQATSNPVNGGWTQGTAPI